MYNPGFDFKISEACNGVAGGAKFYAARMRVGNMYAELFTTINESFAYVQIIFLIESDPNRLALPSQLPNWSYPISTHSAPSHSTSRAHPTPCSSQYALHISAISDDADQYFRSSRGGCNPSVRHVPCYQRTYYLPPFAGLITDAYTTLSRISSHTLICVASLNVFDVPQLYFLAFRQPSAQSLFMHTRERTWSSIACNVALHTVFMLRKHSKHFSTIGTTFPCKCNIYSYILCVYLLSQCNSDEQNS